MSAGAGLVIGIAIGMVGARLMEKRKHEKSHHGINYGISDYAAAMRESSKERFEAHARNRLYRGYSDCNR